MPASASDEGNFARSAILDNRYADRRSGRGRSPRGEAKSTTMNRSVQRNGNHDATLTLSPEGSTS